MLIHMGCMVDGATEASIHSGAFTILCFGWALTGMGICGTTLILGMGRYMVMGLGMSMVLVGHI